MSRMVNRSAPALNDRALADAMITPLTPDLASESTTADSSDRSCGVQVFTGLPGTSSTMVMMLSESIVVRTADSMVHSVPVNSVSTLCTFQQDGGALPAADAQ